MPRILELPVVKDLGSLTHFKVSKDPLKLELINRTHESSRAHSKRPRAIIQSLNRTESIVHTRAYKDLVSSTHLKVSKILSDWAHHPHGVTRALHEIQSDLSGSQQHRSHHLYTLENSPRPHSTRTIKPKRKAPIHPLSTGKTGKNSHRRHQEKLKNRLIG